MIEYNDGTFGPIAPATDLLQSVFERMNQELLDAEEIRAIHFGTIDYLHKMRTRGTDGLDITLQAELDDLKERLDILERLHRPGAIKIYQELPVEYL